MQQLHKETDTEQKQLSSKTSHGLRSQAQNHSGSNNAVADSKISTDANLLSSIYNKNVVKHVFGFNISTSTTFLTSGIIEEGSSNTAFMLDLIRPPHSHNVIKTMSSAGKLTSDIKIEATNETEKNSTAPTFAVILWHSLQKVIPSMKAWCPSSGRDDKCRQVRFVQSLPNVLNFLCGENRDTNPIFSDGQLPISLEICLRKNNEILDSAKIRKGALPFNLVVSCKYLVQKAERKNDTDGQSQVENEESRYFPNKFDKCSV